MLHAVEDMVAYFESSVSELPSPDEGLVHTLTTAEIDGDRFTVEEVVANSIVTMVGGQETTTNLIGNGLLTLLRHPDQIERLRADQSWFRARWKNCSVTRAPASTPPVSPPPRGPSAERRFPEKGRR